jgi:hypothetical protein
MINMLESKHQIFFCIDKQGYAFKLRPQSIAEKQQMYQYSYVFLQIGFRPQNPIKVIFTDRSGKLIYPGKMRFNHRYYISRKPIQTIMEAADNIV